MLLLPGGALLGDSEFELFRPPLLAALLFLPVFPLYGAATAAWTERLAPDPPRTGQRMPWPVAALCLLGLAVFVANTVRLAA